MLYNNQIILATLAMFAAQVEARPTELAGLIDDLDESIDDWEEAWTTLPTGQCYRKFEAASQVQGDLADYVGSVNENEMHFMECWTHFSLSAEEYTWFEFDFAGIRRHLLKQYYSPKNNTCEMVQSKDNPNAWLLACQYE